MHTDKIYGWFSSRLEFFFKVLKVLHRSYMKYDLPEPSLESVAGANKAAKITSGQTVTINIVPALKVSLKMDGSKLCFICDDDGRLKVT